MLWLISDGTINAITPTTVFIVENEDEIEPAKRRLALRAGVNISEIVVNPVGKPMEIIDDTEEL